ncbi:type IV secretion system DNA-binding domain-containing protein [Neisseriaceae bacterium PsAf]|nr:type IV secretion system DNA-binding domain-containing protein [Neisseriaceae bacterium PsAf]
METPTLLIRKLLGFLLFLLLLMVLLYVSLFGMGQVFSHLTHYQFRFDILVRAFYLKDQLSSLNQIFLYACWFFAIVIPLLPVFFTLILKFSNPKPSLHGDTRFANIVELKKNKLIHDKPPTDGILMGTLKNKFIAMTGQNSVFLFATPGTGKTMSVIINNALNFLGSTLFFDQKYEIFKMTAGFRKQISEVHLLNFSGILPPDLAEKYQQEEVSACWNPFTYISSDPRHRQNDLRKMAHVLFEKDLKNNKDAYFAQSAINLFVGMAMLMFEIGEKVTLGNVMSKMIIDANQYQNFNEYIKNLMAVYRDDLSEETVEVLSIFMDGNTKSSQDVLSTMRKTFAFYTGERISTLTGSDSFDLRDLRKNKLSIYVGVQQDDIEIYTPLMKLFFSQVVSTQIKLGTKEQNKEIRNQCLMILDEFGELGDISIIQKMMTLMRGYDIRLLAVFHNLSQLRESYGADRAKTFLSTFQGQIIFTQAVQEDADAMSTYIGFYTEKSTSKGRTKGKNSLSNSVNISDQKRALVLPDELKQMPMNECILTFQGTYPVKAKKTIYSDIKSFNERVNLPLPDVPILDFEQRNQNKPIKETNMLKTNVSGFVKSILNDANIDNVDGIIAQYYAPPTPIQQGD